MFKKTIATKKCLPFGWHFLWKSRMVWMPPRRRRTRKKVVATANRREGVYNQTGEPREPFCEKGGTVKQVTDFLHKKIGTSVTCSDVVGLQGHSRFASYLLDDRELCSQYPSGATCSLKTVHRTVLLTLQALSGFESQNTLRQKNTTQ